MNSEFLIVLGGILVASGSGWLLFDVLVNEQELEKKGKKTITESYRLKMKQDEDKRRLVFVEIALGLLGILAMIFGVYRYGNKLNSEVWFLGGGTLLWYIVVKQSLFLGIWMGVLTVGMGILGGDWIWLWLLTVVGAGFYKTGQKRDKQNLWVQMGAVLNVVSAGENLVKLIWGKQAEKVDFSQLPKPAVSETGHEGLMICPACQETMKLWVIKDGEEKILFDQCPKDGVVFFDDREHLWAIQKIQDIRKQKADNRKQILCPRCQLGMKHDKKENYYQCPECLGNLL